MVKRKIYLENLPLDKAIERWMSKLEENNALPSLAKEKIPTEESHRRITAEAVIARISSPFYHACAMDGVAVRFKDTIGASETKPKTLRIGEDAIYVDTGDPLPEGFDAVIMIEDINVVRTQNSELIEIIEPVTPWQNVRTIGEDIVATELIIPENHCIRPQDIGAMLAAGITEVSVREKPRVAILPTGTELIEPGTPIKKGNIIEFNSRLLGSMLKELGCEPLRSSPLPDDYNLIKKSLLAYSREVDITIINAGASAGSEDYTTHIIADLGEVFVHGVNIKPGKPVILGMVNKKPVVGIPGYPVSAFITFNLFVKPLIYKLQGIEPPEPQKISARLSRQVASSLGQEEFLRVKLGCVGENIIATPIHRGAGALMSLVRADGILRIPALSEGLAIGSVVDVELLRSQSEIENTIVCIGSHDNTLNVLSNSLRKRFPMLSLSSAHVGSLGGLMAIKRGEAHLSGTHLLDEETGEYNTPFIRRLLPEKKIILINLVYREQGLLVPKGNPKNIKGFEDLLRDDVTFINRQAGSGTRLLTDKHLRELGIDPKNVKGYTHEEYTHMGVASAVLTGIADTGLAILASAKALDLDFIPLAKERYDLAIPEEFYKIDMMQKLLSIIREDKEFREHVLSLGGYDISDMGKVIS